MALAQATEPVFGVGCSAAVPAEPACHDLKAVEEVDGAAQAEALAPHSQAAMVAAADIALAAVSVQHSWVASVATEPEPVEELRPGSRAARGEEVLADIAQAGVSAQSS